MALGHRHKEPLEKEKAVHAQCLYRTERRRAGGTTEQYKILDRDPPIFAGIDSKGMW